MSDQPLVRHQIEHGGALRTLVLDHPRGNIVTIAMCEELRRELVTAAEDHKTKLVVLRGAGGDFSFGASVEEHLPDRAETMLAALGGVVADLALFPCPTLAAVEGRCLGGGLEVALGCGLVLVADDALLGSPEIRLGVFAPAATALLARSLGRARYEEILLLGRTFTGVEAESWGIASQLVTAPGTEGMDAAINELYTKDIAPRSAAALRIATQAARETFFSRPVSLGESLAALENTYVDRVLPLADAREGLAAFMEKRAPRWEDS